MEIAPEVVEDGPERRAGRFGWAANNPLARAIARVRAPLAAKLLVGFALVAALLALLAGLGLVSLGQSNTRGKQLLDLQQLTAYEQLLVTDSKGLAASVENRTSYGAATGVTLGYVPPQHRTNAYRVLDEGISTSLDRLTTDFGFNGGYGTLATTPLRDYAPAVVRDVRSDLGTFHRLFAQVHLLDREEKPVSADSLLGLQGLVSHAGTALSGLQYLTNARATALVARNDSSYTGSRNLLLGIGAGSLTLALLLGLLLSWSVVSPLHRTEARLDEIAAGGFTGRLEVPNRDEIGALAERVNRMSDELKGVYRELETASEHKSQFLANMSHELRTPLNAIIGFSEVLREQMFGELNERQLSYVDDVLAAGRHLLSLINDVLDLAKIEAGRMELDLSQVDLPDVLRGAVSMHSERAARAGVGLSLTTDPQQITISADERRLRQVVFNLVSNAVKFTPPDGRVDISARLEDGQVEIAVADTGAGIAPEELDSIFEEFEQTSEGKQAEGTGLGLPLSRKLVELHGGHLWAESQPGHGSIFRFTLPVQQRLG
jgi:signal transduction histidine kinase